MLYRIGFFLKDHVSQGSWLWNFLLGVRRLLERFQRIAWYGKMAFLPLIKIRNLNRFDSKVYSQNGEDGILDAIFHKIGTTNKYSVEFGVEDGMERNTRYLWEKRGWMGLLMDAADNNPVCIKKEFVTAENINELFKKYKVPKTFDLLSIDVDGNDYWIWKALDASYVPRVVSIEYNAKFPPTESKTIAYDVSFQWDKTDYFGASLLALAKLAKQKGYTLVGCDRQGVNAFFVKDEETEGRFVIQPVEKLYRSPQYGKKTDRGGWPASPRPMIEV